MATIHDIAKICKVSETTVTRAFHENTRISDEKRKEILKVSKQYGYAPKTYKKNAARQSKRMIGILLNCSTSPTAERIISGVESVLNKENINLIIANTGDYAEVEITKLNCLKDMVDGIIMIPSHNQSDYSKTFIKEISKTIPIVILSRNIGIKSSINVCIDAYPCIYKATKLLIDNGHQHIAFLNGPLGIQQSFDKLTAYQKALEDNGLPIRSEYITYNNIGEKNATENVERLLTTYPEITAILSGNVSITKSCLIALDKLGYEVGKNIALVSNGTAFPFDLKPYKLTAINNPQFEMGAKGAAAMIKLLPNYKYEKRRYLDDITINPSIEINGSEKYPEHPILSLIV